MKKYAAMLILFASLAHAELTTYVSQFGAWAVCRNHVLAGLFDCSWYDPAAGTETYALNVSGAQFATVAFRYTLVGTLESGAKVTVTGVGLRNDTKSAEYTVIPGIRFGGVVKAVEIQVEELTVINRVVSAGVRR